MKYQPEIDGLRALAVLSVVFFHFGSGWAPGGFVGVDVFFVISGYLITKLLIDPAEEGGLSFRDFYVRRIKRLAPALLTLIVICMSVGFVVLSPGDYEGLSISALWTLIAGSNFFFLNNTGYFDASAQSMPLLHTWSLAIEEQFYLVWPLALLIFVKISGRRRSFILIAVSILMLISFCLSLRAMSKGGLNSFYLAQYRAWELAAGGSLALLRRSAARPVSRVVAELLPAIGLLAIGLAVAILTRDQPFPGFPALLPVLGATAFLFPSGQTTLLHRAFSTSIPVILGRSSYSIYLYHWPVLVFWNHYASFEPISPECQIYLLLSSCALGLLSWKLIEQPFRSLSVPRSRVATVFFATELAIAAACGVVVFKQGWPQRIPEVVRDMASLKLMWDWKCPRDWADEGAGGCEAGRSWGEADHHIFLVGDSHAEHFLPLFSAAAEGKNLSIRLLPDCSLRVKLMPADLSYNQSCQRVKTKNLSLIRAEPRASVLVVFALAWSSLVPYRNTSHGDVSFQAGLKALGKGIDDLFAEVRKSDRPIVFLSDIPLWKIDPIPCFLSRQTPLLRKTCARPTDRLDWAFFNRTQKQIHDLLRTLSKQDGVSIISPEDYLCDHSGCTTTVNGEFIYRDSGHLRRNLKTETLLKLAHILHIDDVVAAAERVDAPSIEAK
jgi:peptidoglycan/LPS O-acetylase OafA/YrhL